MMFLIIAIIGALIGALISHMELSKETINALTIIVILLFGVEFDIATMISRAENKMKEFIEKILERR